MTLTTAHQGYEYQDLIVAARLVDVMLGAIVDIRVDEKLFPNDIFDDLTTVDVNRHRERTQVKYTASDHPLTLDTFTGGRRSLRLDRVIAAALADRDGPATQAPDTSFRILLRDTSPTDPHLLAALEPASPDPGPLVPGMNSQRMRFRADALSEGSACLPPDPTAATNPFAFLRLEDATIESADLDWVCHRLVLELAAPAASLDLTEPGVAEQLLLQRVQTEVGAAAYPNVDRPAIDVAEALIRCARAARQGSITVTIAELLRRTRLRSDFGAVARSNPVDPTIEVSRSTTVAALLPQVNAAADEGGIVLLLGPPGHGKSWICQQLIDSLSAHDWLVAEHFCYLGEADTYRLPRVRAESVFGSLLQRLVECDPTLVADQRPRFAADEPALENALAEALRKKPDGRVALVVDGLDHVTRVIGGLSDGDPSLLLASALASLTLPSRSVLIVLTQPGPHLEPLQAAEPVRLAIPPMTAPELRELATGLEVVAHPSRHSPPLRRPPLLSDQDATDEFLQALSDRSAGNALYATYLCREVLRTPTTVAAPAVTVRGLPQFDGSLRLYYQHIHNSLGEQGAWVADVIALLDFPVSRNDLKSIRPDMAHRVDAAFEVLRPVLLERATQGGARVYHESFARFLRLPFQDDPTARTALLDRIIAWLEPRGIFTDPRTFRHLLRTLADANYNRRVVRAVDRNFVADSLAAGFPPSAIVANLATAVRCAARIGDWPAAARYVEMTRSIETYEAERFESAAVGFVDVIASILGADTLADRLLHDGRPIVGARSGLQMCAALDALGAVVPWQEYMAAFLREGQDDNTAYGEASDRHVAVAWIRGRLRLAFSHHTSTGRSGDAPAAVGTDDDPVLTGPVNWEGLAKQVNDSDLPPRGVIYAIVETHGLPRVLSLLPKLARSGDFYLELAEGISANRIPDSSGDALYWAERAAACPLSPGKAARALALGVQVGDLDPRAVEEARRQLIEVTREVRVACREADRIGNWLDACAVAARRDSLGLATAEALLTGPGWYHCWLRFTMAVVRAEAGTPSGRSKAGLAALRILAEVRNPFIGDPRACDLYPIHGFICETAGRALSLLDERDWDEGVQVLDGVSDAISTTLQGALCGPLGRDTLLHLVVDAATPCRARVAEALLNRDIEHGAANRYYSDLAEYRLLAARLALITNDRAEARRRWRDACRLLVAYGQRKDATIYEVLDPLPTLVAVDAARGRAAVARVQPLCERVPLHTDGKGTRHAWSQWWGLLAIADPCAVSRLVQPRLLGACNDPNSLLHGARTDLWRAWHARADPFVSAALRLTLDGPLHDEDVDAFAAVAATCTETGDKELSRLLVALLARVDERPFEYGSTDSAGLLDRDRERVAALNAIAERANAPRIGALPPSPPKQRDGNALETPEPEARRARYFRERVGPVFRPGAAGIGEAIRAWRKRAYDESRSGWSVERFATCLGYRLVELSRSAQEGEAEAALRLIPEVGGFGDTPELMKALGEGLERYGCVRLASIAYTLGWTRARGGGGWLTFGGETEAECLRRAAAADRSLVLEIIATEIEGVVSRGSGTNGIAQGLMYGFAKCGLQGGHSLAFDIWDETFAVIADRAPRVAAEDDPEDVYLPPNPDSGEDPPGELDVAFARATVAALAHPGREQKRRAFLATEMLIDERPTTVATVIETALLSLSDCATLTWLLRVMELRGDKAAAVVGQCRVALRKLTERPHLTVRTLARRLLKAAEVRWVGPRNPDPELLDRSRFALVLPFGSDADDGERGACGDLVEDVSGVRLARAERLVRGLRRAVVRRVEEAKREETCKQRMRAQLEAYADQLRQRWPDIFLAAIETVETAIQESAAGARAARLLNGQAVGDPVRVEELLAQTLLDDPTFPLALERTRLTRPDIPAPPTRGDVLWAGIRDRAEGHVEEAGVETASCSGGELRGTLAILGPEAVPTLVGGPYDDWRLVATVERRVVPSGDLTSEDRVAVRHLAIELRVPGDRESLGSTPIAPGDVAVWNCSSARRESGMFTRTNAVVGCDAELRAAGDSRHGLGLQGEVLTPGRWLMAALGLTPRDCLALEDDRGLALALVSWRTEYATSDYYLTWPRLCGTGIVVRRDVFEGLVRLASGGLVYRDFLIGSPSLCE